MTRGMIAILSRDGANLDYLTRWVRAQDGWDLVQPRGDEIAHQRNEAVLTFLATSGERLVFIDSDCAPPLDALSRLAARNRPLLGGVVLDRTSMEVCATKAFEPLVRVSLSETARPGVIPVVALGTGCLMVHREVFVWLDLPWFRCGQLVADVLAEDTDFCLRAAERGFPPSLDCEVRTGHVVQGIAWPREDGIWVQWEGAPYLLPLAVVHHEQQEARLPLGR